jgi:hypothetical protein
MPEGAATLGKRCAGLKNPRKCRRIIRFGCDYRPLFAEHGLKFLPDYQGRAERESARTLLYGLGLCLQSRRRLQLRTLRWLGLPRHRPGLSFARYRSINRRDGGRVRPG